MYIYKNKSLAMEYQKKKLKHKYISQGEIKNGRK